MAGARTQVQEDSDGRVQVRIIGRLDAWSTAACWRELDERLRSMRVASLEVDVAEATLSGVIGAVLLRYLAEGGMTPGVPVELRGLRPEFRSIADILAGEDFRGYRPRRPAKHPIPVEVGQFVTGLFRDLYQQIAFLGSIVRVLPGAVLHPKQMRWREVRRLMEVAGANALPIVAVISALVGVVTVLEAAHPLAKFGAQIFLADMIGFSSLRDTGPVVTAILLAGRSGAAFAAELGTMKVNQELDALTTMGLNPIRFLVVQRLAAAVLLTPLLTLYAMLMGILGGILVMRSLGFPPLMIYHQILGRVGLTDLAVGLTKSAIFGAIIGAMACLRGLQTGQGPSAVGVSATRSVIACILLIILANTLYSAAQYFWT